MAINFSDGTSMTTSAVGKLLQVQTSQVTSHTACTPDTQLVWKDTAMTKAITVSANTSKILVRATFGMTNSNENYYAHAFLYRGSTLIGSSVATGKGGGNGIHSQSIERLDSPNTTSSTTYTLRLAAEGNTAKIGRGATASSDSDQHDDLSIVLMEIKV